MRLHRCTIKSAKLASDLAAFGVCYALAYVIRFEGRPPRSDLATLAASLPYVIAVKLFFLAVFRVPRLTWRYVGLPEAQRLFAALLAATLALVGLRLLGDRNDSVLILPLRPVPLGVLAIDLELSFLGAVAARAAVRVSRERSGRRLLCARDGGPGVRVVPAVLIGAGAVGAATAREIRARADLGIRPVAFLDDDRGKLGLVLHGVEVVGTTDDLPRVARETGARQALITVRDTAAVRRITRLCRQCRLTARVIPGIAELVRREDRLNGRTAPGGLVEFSTEDILPRAPVTIDDSAVADLVTARTVLVTGAGGSIASELCRKLCRYRPTSLLLVEQAENSLFTIHRRLGQEHPDVRTVPLVADICDRPRMEAIFAAHRPEIVFHGAAHKHVPMMEWNPCEAVKNNVLGTRTIALLAGAHGVARFVMISTDKAVKPTSVMGVTKRIAEVYLQTLATRSPTRFVTVRFGNVMGSAGSVVPIFREQINRGGPVTVTHPDMTRYMMTIPEACELVLQAAAMGKRGDIFILDMGTPVKILDLARRMIDLAGLDPDDIAIEFTGIRPGEKLHEELTLAEERAEKTANDRIFIGRQQPCDPAWMDRQLAELEQLVAAERVSKVFPKLREVVPEYEHAPPAGDRPQPVPVRADPPHGLAGPLRRPETADCRSHVVD